MLFLLRSGLSKILHQFPGDWVTGKDLEVGMVEVLEWESQDFQSFGVESSSELSAQDFLVLLGLTRGWGSAKQEPTLNLH